MRRTLIALLSLVGLLVAKPALAATALFNFSYQSFPDESYVGSGELTLDPVTGGTNSTAFAITGISGYVSNVYLGAETNRWAITSLNDFRSNALDSAWRFTADQAFYAGLAFGLDGGPGLVLISPSANDYFVFVGEIGGRGDFSITPVGSVVPEPASWALMIAGFALIGVGLRARRSRSPIRMSYAI